MKLYGNGINEISVGGVRYRAAADGSFDVPPEAVALLLSHGLTREAPRPPARVSEIRATKKAG